MNPSYLRWLLVHECRQPAVILMMVVSCTLLMAFAWFCSFSVVGGYIVAMHLGGTLIDNPYFIFSSLLPSFVDLLISILVFLFILAHTGATLNSFFHPINRILLTTPLTRSELFFTSFASTLILFAVISTAGFCTAGIIVFVKTGYSLFLPMIKAALWLCMTFFTYSNFSSCCAVVFKNQTTVLILLLSVMLLGPALGGREEWYFKAICMIVPMAGIFQNMVVTTLFSPSEILYPLWPFLISLIYLSAGYLYFIRQDVN